jgi:hypothetical protein
LDIVSGVALFSLKSSIFIKIFQMKPYRKNKVPVYYGLRIYLLSTLLYFFLVFPVVGILVFRDIPDYIENRNKSEQGATSVSDTIINSLADSLSSDKVADTKNDTAAGFTIRIGSGSVNGTAGTAEDSDSDRIEMGGTLVLLFPMLVISYLVGLFFNMPFKRYFRKKREKQPVSQKLHSYCKKLLLHTPRINMGILALPFLVHFWSALYTRLINCFFCPILTM